MRGTFFVFFWFVFFTATVYFFLGVMLCGGSVEMYYGGAASLTHEICPVNNSSGVGSGFDSG